MQNGKCASLSGGVYSDGLSSNTGRADLISANGSSGKGNYAMVKANLLSARWTVVFYCRLTFESNYGTVDPGPFWFVALSLVAWLSLSLCLSHSSSLAGSQNCNKPMTRTRNTIWGSGEQPKCTCSGFINTHHWTQSKWRVIFVHVSSLYPLFCVDPCIGKCAIMCISDHLRVALLLGN